MSLKFINDLSLQETWTHCCKTVKSNVETGNGILLLFGHGHTTKTTTNKVKAVNVVVDWSPNPHAVANGGPGSSLEYHYGAFLRV